MENDRKKLKKSKKNAKRQLRGSPTITAAQRARFLDNLSKTLNVTASAVACGFDRNTAYAIRARDVDFAAAWQHAIGTATDSLQNVAMDLSIQGEVEYIVTKDGRVVMDPRNPGEPLVNRKRDSRMLMFLLTHRKPEVYRPATMIAVGSDIPAELQPDPPATPDEERPEKPVV